MAEIDRFLPLLMQHEEEGLLCPVLSHGKVHFMWIKHSNLYRILVLKAAAGHAYSEPGGNNDCNHRSLHFVLKIQ